MNIRRNCGLAVVVLVWSIGRLGFGQAIVAEPYRASGIYDIGEKVGWTVSVAKDEAAPTGNYSYTIKKNNLAVLTKGELDLSSSKATLETSLDEPGMLYVQITPPPAADSATDATADHKAKAKGRGSKVIALGAAVAPTKIEPLAQQPDDFDAFWEDKIKLLKSTPENAVLEAGESGKESVEYSLITMDNINGAHIHGQLAKPKKEGKFPGLLIFQWAGGPYPLQKSWVIDKAAAGWLAVNIEPHDVLPTEAKEYYDSLPAVIKNYQRIGQDDREKSYFLQMYLADYRAAEYLASRPDWDGKILVAMGTSMGGQQSLCVAGLHPKITHVIVDEPAGCDTNGPLHGRQSGYPNFPSNNPKVMATALYFDPVSFASRIKATSLVAMGFVDTTAPPAGIYAALNQIAGAKEAAPMVDSPHNNLATPAQQRPFTQGSGEWLKELVSGGKVNPGED